jgi:flagellar protein FliJ
MFRFKLQAVLHHRRQQEEMAQKELAKLQQKLATEQEKLHIEKRVKRLNLLELREKQRNSSTVSEIRLSLNYLAQLSKNIEIQTLRVQKVEKTVIQKRNELISIMKKRKTLEKLKDKEWQGYRQKLAKNERTLMDEVAAARHIRSIQLQ